MTKPSLVCLVVALFVVYPVSAQEEVRLNPLHTPGIEFLRDPIPAVDSEAKTQAEMKPYIETITGTNVTFQMVPIPGGKFLMGSPVGEEGREDHEGPQVEVEILPFWMEEHEVTWGEFEQYFLLRNFRSERTHLTDREKAVDAMARPSVICYDMNASSYGKANKLDHPASAMSCYAAQVYCKWLTAVTGRYYRLPTEAEWEYACRAGSTTAFSFGDDPGRLDDYGWFFDNTDNGYNKVMAKKPNAWGLYDMHGNVAEWVLGLYDENVWRKIDSGEIPSLLIRPGFDADTKAMMHVAIGDNHIACGGSCDHDAKECRSAAKLISQPEWKEYDPFFPKSIWSYTEAPFVGFRVIRPLNPPKTEEECKLYEPNPGVFDVYIKWSRPSPLTED